MQQLEQLKNEKSLCLVEDMPVIWPKQCNPTPLKVSGIIKYVKHKKVYAFTSKVIAFVSGDSLYVTPYNGVVS